MKYDNDTYVRNIAYNAKGQRILIAFGNDVMTRYAYDDETFRLLRQRSEKYTRSVQGERIFYNPVSGNNRQDDGYQYDLIGNILEINHRKSNCGVGGTDSLDRSFDYDPLNRLLEATGRENVPSGGYPMPGWDDTTRDTTANSTVGYTRRYRYDKLGNIDLINQVGTNSFTRIFKYPLSGGSQINNKLSQVLIGSNTTNYTYDDNGNQLTEHSNRHFKWDAKDQLVLFKDQAGTSEPSVAALYLYDSQGNRVKKLVRKNGKYEIRTYIDGVFEYFTDETDEQNTIHIMDDKSRIATLRIGDAMGDTTPAIKFVLENNIGSSSILLDNTGSVVNEQEYYPFGETSFGSHGKKRYQYVGKERDEESGMYYYGARYYAPWTCRFISVDPLAGKYADINPYNYAGNKPIGKIDIDGLQEEGRKPTQDQDSPNSEEIKSDAVKDESTELSIPAVNTVQVPDALNTEYKILNNQTLPGSYFDKENSDNNTERNNNTAVELSGELAGYISLTADAIEELGGLERAQQLIEGGEWEVVYKNELKTWSLNFYGGPTVSADFVKQEKVSFLNKAAKNSKWLKRVKGMGFVANIAGVLLLYEDVSDNGWNTENKVDAGIMAVGYIPAVGWGLSLVGIEAKLLADHFSSTQFYWNNNISSGPNGINQNKTRDEIMFMQEMKKAGVNHPTDLFRSP